MKRATKVVQEKLNQVTETKNNKFILTTDRQTDYYTTDRQTLLRWAVKRMDGTMDGLN